MTFRPADRTASSRVHSSSLIDWLIDWSVHSYPDVLTNKFKINSHHKFYQRMPWHHSRTGNDVRSDIFEYSTAEKSRRKVTCLHTGISNWTERKIFSSESCQLAPCMEPLKCDGWTEKTQWGCFRTAEGTHFTLSASTLKKRRSKNLLVLVWLEHLINIVVWQLLKELLLGTDFKQRLWGMNNKQWIETENKGWEQGTMNNGDRKR